MVTNKIQTGVRFQEEMLKKIKFIAEKNCRSFNAQMEYLAQECIEAYEKEHGEISIIEEEE